MAIRGDIDPIVERFLAGMPVCTVCLRAVGSVWVKKLVSHSRYMVIVRCHSEVSTVWLTLDGDVTDHPEGGPTEHSRQLSSQPRRQLTE